MARRHWEAEGQEDADGASVRLLLRDGRGSVSSSPWRGSLERERRQHHTGIGELRLLKTGEPGESDRKPAGLVFSILRAPQHR